MRTASISWPSGSLNRYFTKPSAARRRSSTSSSGQVARRVQRRGGRIGQAAHGARAGTRPRRRDGRGRRSATRRRRRRQSGATAAASSSRSRLRRLSDGRRRAGLHSGPHGSTLPRWPVPSPASGWRRKSASTTSTPPTRRDRQGRRRSSAIEKLGRELSELENLLTYAGTHALLVVLQGRDASGKDGTIRKILEFSNIQQTLRAPVQGADRGGARPRLPVARPQGGPAPRVRDAVQPLALRGRAGGARPPPGAARRSGKRATRTSTRSSG